MLRISAECTEVPDSVLATIRKVQELAARHVRKVSSSDANTGAQLTSLGQRCEQFITLSQSKSSLRKILSDAKSASVCETHSPLWKNDQLQANGNLKLPDFMLALEAWSRESVQQRTSSPPRAIVSPERPTSRASSRASQPPGKLRYTAYEAPKPTPRLRRIPSNSSFTHSDTSRFVGQDADDTLSRTVTAGQLALATEQIELQALTKVR